MSWSKNRITSEISITPRIPANPNAHPPVQEVTTIQTTGVTFQINNTKFYVPVVTLSINQNTKFLEIYSNDLKEQVLGTNIHLK